MNDFTAAAEALEAAKIAEAQATAARIDAETALIVLCGTLKDEGSTTVRQDGFKVTVTTRINRTVDEAVIGAVRAAMPEALFENAFRTKWEIATPGLRYLQNNEPDLYAIAAQAVTARPGKPAVAIERVALARAA